MKTCLICGKALAGLQTKFCSRTHQHRYKSAQRTVNGYWARYRRGEHRECADCGAPILTASTRCRKCNQKNLRRTEPSVKPHRELLNCPYCCQPRGVRVWRTMRFARCSTCGLETTLRELKRINLQEAA